MDVKHFIVQSSKLNSQMYKPGGRGRGSVDVVQVVFLDAGVAVAAMLAFKGLFTYYVSRRRGGGGMANADHC